MIPERKSFPPRTILTVVGTMLAFCLGCSLVIGSVVWRESQSAEKQLAEEIWQQLASSNLQTRTKLHDLLTRFGRNGRNGSSRNVA
jgi:uncharacterized protein involved in exopolysaccharide biosynthesis